jgi:hypothetical protein
LRPLNLDQGGGADLSNSPDQRNRDFVRDVESFDKNGLVALKTNRIVDENSCELVEAGIVHRGLRFHCWGGMQQCTLMCVAADQLCRESAVEIISEWLTDPFLD